MIQASSSCSVSCSMRKKVKNEIKKSTSDSKHAWHADRSSNRWSQIWGHGGGDSDDTARGRGWRGDSSAFPEAPTKRFQPDDQNPAYQ